MLVILEGPDGSGKTTLADNLEDLLRRFEPTSKVVRAKAGVPTRHPLREYLLPVEAYRPGTGVHYVLDRWHWGEYVYPQLRGRASQLDPPAWWTIDNYLRRLGAVVVTCSQYPDRYRQVYRDRGEPESQVDELPQLAKLYREVEALSVLPSVTYNWNSAVNGDLYRILECAQHAEEETRELSGFRTYLGYHRPDLLLLGDVRHRLRDDPALPPNLDPAFVPFPGTSGHYLLGALHLANEPPGRAPTFGLANACDVDDPLRLWRALGEPTVVTLGRNATRRWRRLRPDARVAAVPHPQYVRRFHHSMKRGYGMLIWATALYGGDNGSWPLSSKLQPAGTRTSRSSSTSDVAAAPLRAATDRRARSTT